MSNNETSTYIYTNVVSLYLVQADAIINEIQQHKKLQSIEYNIGQNILQPSILKIKTKHSTHGKKIDCQK